MPHPQNKLDRFAIDDTFGVDQPKDDGGEVLDYAGDYEPKEVATNCAFDEMLDIEAVKPNPRNPNRHTHRQVGMLAAMILHQGWRAPVTISKRSGFVVRGHGRLLAARRLGLKVIPVDYQDYASDTDETADLIGDNRIAELAEFDLAEARVLFDEIQEAGLNIRLTGFTPDEIEKMFAELDIDEVAVETFEPDEPQNECPKCGFKW